MEEAKKEDKKIINGYFFESNQEYIKAQREKQVVDQMKQTIDWKNPNTAYQLYLKILDKNSFTTIIGIHFLWELRSIILRSEMELNRELPAVQIKGMEIVENAEKGSRKRVHQSAAMSALQEAQVEKYRLTAEKYQSSAKMKNIVIAFLILIIVGMLAVSQLTPYSVFTDYENRIINQYEEWEKELEEREAAVTERENALKGQ